MCFCNQFDQTQMTAWENKTRAIKTDWTETKRYFKQLVRNFKIYKQNSSGTIAKSKYKNANQATEAAKCDKLRHYIATIAAAAVTKDKKQDKIAGNIRDSAQKKINYMVMQLKMLSNAVVVLTKALANKENNGGSNIGGGGGGGSSSSNGGSGGIKPLKKLQCMGGYCWSHGHHPCGNNHTSATCIFKKEGHKSDATLDNTMGGNNYWPLVYHVIDSQKCTHHLLEKKVHHLKWGT